MKSRACGLLALILCFFAMPPKGSAQVKILTNRNDNARTGANLSETRLNTANVSVNNFGKLWTYSIDGAVFAQPLYVPSLSIGGVAHNVLFVATMNDKVYALDADSAATLWCVSLTADTSAGACPNPSNLVVSAGTGPIPMEDILPRGDATNYNIVGDIGILSTPVIDDSTNTMYLVARTKETGSPCGANFLGNSNYCQRIHALDITNGKEKFGGPTIIAGSVPGIGKGSSGGAVTFDPAMGNQRPGLALVNGQIFIAYASHEDSTPNYHGWVMSYSASTLTQTGIFCVTPNSLDTSSSDQDGGKGGIWMWGRAPAVDANGVVYYMSGNGQYDGITEFGDSIIGFNSAGGLTYKTSFTPQNEEALDDADLDLGSSGPMMIPGTNLLVGAGKSSILYVMDTTNAGDFGLEGAAPPPPKQDLFINNNINANYVKAGPAYWDRSGGLGPWLYIWPENDVAKAYHFNGATFDDGGTIPATPISTGTIGTPGGNAGPIITLSANGSAAGSGILWASMPTSEDADVGIHLSTLRAINADDLTKELWNSDQNSARDGVGNWGKTVPPSVANGKVYIPSFPSSATGPFPNNVLVYGLFDFTISATPPSNTVYPGGAANYPVNTTSVYPSGFPSNVTYSVSGLPAGATPSFSANGQAVPGTSTFTVTTASSTPAGTYTLTITGAGGIQTHSATVTLVVTYNICLLYNPTFAKKSGSTYPIKLQICDANGNNLSSSSVVLQAQSVTVASTNAPGLLDDSGDSNPDFDFRYDSTLPGYIFNLSLKGVSTGSYNLNFTVSGDPVTHSAAFQVK